MITLRRSLVLLAAAFAAQQAQAIDPANPYPGAAPGGTNFLNKTALLGSANDPAWFLNNIPFLEVPDTQIQQVYYYRWQSLKGHFVYTGPIFGWLTTEFLSPTSYAAPYGGINCAAGHHINEAKWLRNQQYVKDNINYWLNGPGQNDKQGRNNPNAPDWAHDYSFWAASAVWQYYLATGDRAFTVQQKAALVAQYRDWDNHFNASLGLYWQVPLYDGTEFTPASYESNDHFGGGPGYRPTINGYQYGDARAISSIASMDGDSVLANEYSNRANALQTAVNRYLWDPSRNFYFHMNRDNNAALALLDTRELEGYVPWMFNLPSADKVSGFTHLFDSQGFAANYGPTTVERRSRWFNYEANLGCCHWTGPSWPFETAQALTGLANQLIDYPAQGTVTKQQYTNLLHTYAATQYRNGVPYIAEAHDADANTWIYDGWNHSEDYNHSTYNDNVITGLVGLRPQANDTVVVQPLAPDSWDYFALENTPYHGHNITVIWDRTGSRYGQGAGLTIFVDGARAANSPTLGRLVANVGAPITQSNANGWVNIAANSQRVNYGPQPFASYLFDGGSGDGTWNVIDGIVFRTGLPQNTRWTSYASTNASDSFGVNFQRNVTVRELRLTFYDDGGGVRVPASYDLQYWNGSGWQSIPGQSRNPATPAPNAMVRVSFPKLGTSQIRVVAPNAGNKVGWGLSELQAMNTPVFKINNVNSNKLLAVSMASLTRGAAAQQYQDNGTRDHLWELVDGGGGYFKIRNVNSGLVLGVTGQSTADSAQVLQWDDNGTEDHLWTLVDTGAGRFKIRNKRSGLLLGVDQMSLADSANVVQFHDNGTADHLWEFRVADDPR